MYAISLMALFLSSFCFFDIENVSDDKEAVESLKEKGLKFLIIGLLSILLASNNA